MKTSLFAFGFLLLGGCSIAVPTPDTGSATKPSGGSNGSIVTTKSPDLPTPTTFPKAVSIQAQLPSDTKALHLTDEGHTQVSSSLVLNTSDLTLLPAPPPPATPKLGSSDAVVTIVSPDPGTCTPSFYFSADLSSLSVVINGSDDVSDASASCATWTNLVASQGITLNLTNVPWNDAAVGTNDRTTVTLTIQ